LLVSLIIGVLPGNFARAEQQPAPWSQEQTDLFKRHLADAFLDVSVIMKPSTQGPDLPWRIIATAMVPWWASAESATRWGLYQACPDVAAEAMGVFGEGYILETRITTTKGHVHQCEVVRVPSTMPAAPRRETRTALPVHESNVEQCHVAWRGRPQEEGNCLRAREELSETLQRNPYDDLQEKYRTECRSWAEYRVAANAEDVRLKQKFEDLCIARHLREPKLLSFWYGYFHSAAADAVMWGDHRQAGDARQHLDVLQKCHDERLDDPESLDYAGVLACAGLGYPQNSLGYKFGPRD
jgi:hypothetical protein